LHLIPAYLIHRAFTATRSVALTLS
jgi:hypothetical protein